MNFYKHHIGDYAQATAHLSFVEDAAYSRLLRKYYAEEKPLPADLKAVQRLVGARTREEREAVETVLGEFFDLQADGWHNKRADAELARANAQAETNRQIAVAREERKKASKPFNECPTQGARIVHESLNESLASREPSQTPDSINTPPVPPAGGEPGRAKAEAIGFPAWCAMVKAKGEKLVPEGDPVFAYAERVGLPDDFLLLAWREFQDRYSDGTKPKRYRDWRAVFRNAVRGNWFKLWWHDGNGYALTTAGMQAAKAHQRTEAEAA